MNRVVAIAAACLMFAAWCQPALSQVSKLRVGYCARTLSGAVSPFAIATKMGWFKDDGIEVSVVPMAGSSDCMKAIATREIPFALVAVEAHGAAILQGVKGRTFYTAYQTNIYGLAVPADSAIKQVSDLRGKTIGVISMGGGVLFAKGVIAAAGMDPEQDVRFVVAGEAAQTAVLVRAKQVDALSQFDTQYALIENAGVKLRLLETKETDRFPGNGFLALEETLKTHRAEAVALARGYAKGTIFAINNPEAAVRILYEIFPQVRPTGKDEATAVRDDTRVLQARIPHWRPEQAAVRRWGESSEANYSAYLDFLLKWGVLSTKVNVQDVITNELIGEINRFDADGIAAGAKAFTYH